MKKCPKCGTILDDSKKRCYMCGTELSKTVVTNFGDTFDEQIGATVTKSQDNVFNNVSNINPGGNGNNQNINIGATLSNNSSSANFYKDQMNGLNGVQYDDRTALEKIFTGDARFQSRDEINAREAMNANRIHPTQPNNNGFNSFPNNNVKKPMVPNNNLINNPQVNNNNNNFQMMPKPNIPNNMGGMQNRPNGNNLAPGNINNNVNQVKKKKGLFGRKAKKQKIEKQVPNKVQKPEINWGNNLNNASNNTSNYQDKVSRNNGINLPFIFNTSCFILFLIGMVFIYVKYIRVPKSEIINLSGLNYKVDKQYFMEKSSDDFSNYYTHGEACAIRVSYGATNDGESYIDREFEKVKEQYAHNKNISVMEDKMRINNNTWSSLSILELNDNPTAIGGVEKNIRFNYVSIVYKGNFYNIIFANTNGDSECGYQFDQFKNTLAFD